MSEPTKPFATYNDKLAAAEYEKLNQLKKARASVEAELMHTLDQSPPTQSADLIQVGGDHYSTFEIQPAQFIAKNGIPFLQGCVIKRMCRLGKKGGSEGAIEDLRKAIHEIRLIALYDYGEDL